MPAVCCSAADLAHSRIAMTVCLTQDGVRLTIYYVWHHSEANVSLLVAVPIGDTIPDFEVLGFGKCAQAYFISCGDCEALFATDAEALALWQAEQEEVNQEMQKLRVKQEAETGK